MAEYIGCNCDELEARAEAAEATVKTMSEKISKLETELSTLMDAHQALARDRDAFQLRIAKLVPLIENEKVAARAASKAMSEAQEREDEMRGGTPGPYVHCTTCGRAMVWARNVWMCPVHVHDRMQIAEDRVVELETLETARGQAVSELKARRDQLKKDNEQLKRDFSNAMDRAAKAEAEAEAISQRLVKFDEMADSFKKDAEKAEAALKQARGDFHAIAQAVLGDIHEGEASVDDVVNYVKKERLLAVETAEHCGKYKELFELLRQERDGEVWCWQGDGEDHLESLTCPVLIRPEILKAMHDESVTAAIRRGDFEAVDARQVALFEPWDKARTRTYDADSRPKELDATWIFAALRVAAAGAEEESPGGATIDAVTSHLQAIAHSTVTLVDSRNALRKSKGLDPILPEVQDA